MVIAKKNKKSMNFINNFTQLTGERNTPQVKIAYIPTPMT